MRPASYVELYPEREEILVSDFVFSVCAHLRIVQHQAEITPQKDLVAKLASLI